MSAVQMASRGQAGSVLQWQALTCLCSRHCSGGKRCHKLEGHLTPKPVFAMPQADLAGVVSVDQEVDACNKMWDMPL